MTDDVLRGVLQAEIEIAARLISREPATLTTADAVQAIREFGLRSSQRAPLIEVQMSIPEPDLQHILAEFCERYGAGIERKNRQRLPTVTAPRAFIDAVLNPLVQAMLDLVIAARDEQVRSLVDGLRASAPDETTPPS